MDRERFFIPYVPAAEYISDSSVIRKYAAVFYKDLYTSELSDHPEVYESLYAGLPQVSAEVNVELDAQLSLSELSSALMSLQNGRAPGIDGLPVDFYKSFWSVLEEDLLEVQSGEGFSAFELQEGSHHSAAKEG